MLPVAIVACALLLSCGEGTGKRPPKEKQTKSDAVPAPAPAPAPAPEQAPDAKKPTPPTKKDPAPEKPAGNLAELLPKAPLAITKILGRTPPEAQEHLGEPTGKGMVRTSCLRRMPKKVWFECKYAYQRYTDPTGTYTAIQVVYEDGKAASIAFEGVPGEGPFDPVKALAKVGLKLPGKPGEQEPAENVKLWSWFNDQARLVLDKLQYRVEVSTVSGEWKHSKVEIFLNHPLNAAQKAKIKKGRGANKEKP